MKDFMIDKETGDIIIKNQDIVMVEAEQEVAQQLRTVLKSNNGEWPFNDSYGINYNNLLVKTVDNEIVIDEISRGASQCSGDISIEDIKIDVDRQKRTMSVFLDAKINDTKLSIDGLELI